MKVPIKYYMQSFLLVASLFTLSCEKGTEEVAYEGLVYIPKTGISEVMPLLGESTYRLGVYKSGINDDRKPKVTLDVDPALLEEYLAANPDYEILPEQYYSISNKQINLSGDGERAFLDIQLKNIGEDYVDNRYVLPIRIVEVSDGVKMIPERSSAILRLNRFRNMYEGAYHALGSSYPVDNPSEIKKIDQAVSTLSVTEHVVSVPGAESGMTLHLDISGNKVTVLPAPGSESFHIVDDSSSITGEFNETYQRFKGDIHLKYKYIVDGTEMYAAIDLTFNL